MRLPAQSALGLLFLIAACDKGTATDKDPGSQTKTAKVEEKKVDEADEDGAPKTGKGEGAEEAADGEKAADGEGHANSYRPHDDQIYNEEANAQKEVDAAIAAAKRENKRVLIMYGGNWCSWCWKLHDTMEADAGISKRLEDSYVLVLVSIHENEDFPAKYGTEAKGFPYLSVLDETGKPIVHQETGSLEEGDHHDPAKVLAFLDKYA